MNQPSRPFELSKSSLLVVSLLVGLLCALYADRMAASETRWIVLPLLAIVGGLVVVLSPSRRTLLLSGFFLVTQLNLQLYLGLRRGPSVGSSTPEAIVILAVSLAAAALLLHEMPLFSSSSDRESPPFRWGGQILKPALLGILMIILSGLFADERYVAVCSLVIQVQMVAIFLVAANVVRSEADLRVVFHVLVATLAIQCLVYLLQSNLGFTFSITGQQRYDTGLLQRHGGTVGTNPSTFASYTLPLLFVAIARFLMTDNPRVRWGLGAVAALGIVTLILTFTRAAWAGFAIGLIALVAAGARHRVVRWKPIIALGVIAVVAAIVFAPLIAIRLTNPLDAAATERFTLNEIAFNVIQAHPWLGVGPGGYGYAFRKFIPDDLTYTWLYIVHNAYLLRAAELGVVGLLAMVWVLVAGLRQAAASLKARSELARALALGLFAGICALMWEMMWDIWSELSQRVLLWQLFGILVALRAITTTAPVERPAPLTAPQAPETGGT